MFNISSYLKSLSTKLNSAEVQKKQLLEIIYKHTKISFSEDNVEIKNFTLYVKSSAAQKNKLFMHKNNILEEIKSSTIIVITDLR